MESCRIQSVSDHVSMSKKSRSLQIRLLGHCIICLRKVSFLNQRGNQGGTSDSFENCFSDGGSDVPLEIAPKSVVSTPGFLTTFNQIWAILQLKWKGRNRNCLSDQIGISLEKVLESGSVSTSTNVIFSTAPTICRCCCDKVSMVENLMKAVRQQVRELSMLSVKGRRQGGVIGNFEKTLRENGLEESVIRATLEFVGISDGISSQADLQVSLDDIGDTEGQKISTEEDDHGDPDYVKEEREEGDNGESTDDEDEEEMEVEDDEKIDHDDFQVEKDPLSLLPEKHEDRPSQMREWTTEQGSDEIEDNSNNVDDNDISKLKCSCGKFFASLKLRVRHMRRSKEIHPEFEFYRSLHGNRQTCDLCGEWVMYNDILEHLRDVHLNGQDEWVIRCPNEKCRYLSVSSKEFNAHLYYFKNKECKVIWKEKFGPVCEICGFKGTNMFKIWNHVRDKHENGEEKKWMCPISGCGKRFFIKQSVQFHLYEHRYRPQSQQICNKCGESLKVEEMEEHLKDKHGVNEVIGCKQCELKFSGREEMVEHLFEHRGIGILCDICGDKQDKFLNKYSDFREHYFEVHKLCPKKYKCGEKDCDKWYWRNVDKEDHQMRMHEGNDRNKRRRGNTTEKGMDGKNFECDICNVKFWRGVTLITHNIRVHGADPLKCDICGETFDDKFKFNKHKKEHAGIVFQKEWECEVEGCGKIFKSKKFWKRHREVGHGGVKRHVCETCGKSYYNAGGLRNHHEIVHLGLRRWVCEECGEKFSSGTALKKHKLIHTGERPFGCDICGQRFRHQGVLARHVKGHEEKGADFKPNGPMKQIRKRKAQ